MTGNAPVAQSMPANISIGPPPAEPVRTIQARIPWDDDWQPMACPDKRCGNHGAAVIPVADPRDPTGEENRCPVCLTTLAPIPQARS